MDIIKKFWDRDVIAVIQILNFLFGGEDDCVSCNIYKKKRINPSNCQNHKSTFGNSKYIKNKNILVLRENRLIQLGEKKLSLLGKIKDFFDLSNDSLDFKSYRSSEFDFEKFNNEVIQDFNRFLSGIWNDLQEIKSSLKFISFLEYLLGKIKSNEFVSRKNVYDFLRKLLRFHFKKLDNSDSKILITHVCV